MKKIRKWLHYEDDAPKWEKAIKFGNIFSFICLGIGLLHIVLMFFGYIDIMALWAAFGSALAIHAGVWFGKRNDNIKITVAIFFVGLLLFGHYSFAMGGGDGTGPYWCFLQPMIAMYVLGLYYGTLFVVIQTFLLFLYFFVPLPFSVWPYTESEIVFIPLAYISLSAVTIFSQMQIRKTEAEQKELIREAERANASKSDFLANMSHEIRTPMNAIMGMCEMTLNGEVSEETRENINSALVAGNNLMGIINDILDFSKIDSGKLEIIETVYETTSLLNDVVNLVESRKKDQNLEFMVDYSPEIPCKLIGDEVRIRQILVNLLTNAVKYTKKGGVLFTVSFREESYGINLRFSIKDSGIGIKKENIKKIFTSFSQVDTKKNREVEGTGLGLPIARQLAEAMGGFIRVESVYGRGSEFILILPQKVADFRPMVEVPDREKIKGLYYIDFEKYGHPFVKSGYQQVISHAISGLHFSCDYCKNGEELREKLAEGYEYTHLFVAREEFLKEKELIERAALHMQVRIIQGRYSHAAIPKNMVSVFKPVHVVSVANALKYKKRGEEADKKSREKSFQAPSAKILVVDDNIINLKVAMGLMIPYRVQTEPAESGQEAIEKLRASRDYDLVFLDHMMPGMDGVETAAQIRSMEGKYYAELPIVALTANTVSGIREMYLSRGFQDYLAKPIELNQLEQILRTWIPEEKQEKAGEENDE
ncbi:MAG: ATP-binding protein [Eubacteriales bacterium]|nr:ATP-binding protein [Eubacteriales bacterium]